MGAPLALDGGSPPTALNAQRLVWIRMIAVPGSALCLILAQRIYGLSLAVFPLAVIAGGLILFNALAWLRLQRRQAISDREFFVQILVDLLALSGILYYAGGAANPFVFFFLLPTTISAAAALPRSYTWAMAAISAVLYTLLLEFRVEVPEFLHGRSRSPFDLHVMGMWLGFVVIAGMIAHFVAAMAETVRERDRYLAQLREAALRDERVVALATLAAGAAHELSTPLATMAVLTGELSVDYPAKDYPALERHLALLRDQIKRCKEALSVISASAGATRAEAAERLCLDDFARSAVEEVRRLRPGANVAMELLSAGPAPRVFVERTMRQALLNILHNAVDASPRHVRLTCAWDGDHVELAVIDQGGGIGTGYPGSMDRLGVSSKEGGLGLGLFLSHAAINQLGGRLLAENNDSGGTTVTMLLPLARLTEAMA